MGFREILLFLRSSGSLRERFWCWCCCCCWWWWRWCWWCWCWWCCWCFCWNSCCWMWCGRKWDFPQSKESSENLSFQAKKEAFRKMEMQKRLKGQWPNFKQAVRIFFLVPCYNCNKTQVCEHQNVLLFLLNLISRHWNFLYGTAVLKVYFLNHCMSGLNL